MAAPTFVASYAVADWFNLVGAGGSKTASVTTAVGDRLVVIGLVESVNALLNTPTGNGLTYSLAQSNTNANTCAGYLWTATDNTGGTWTMTVSQQGAGNQRFGFVVLRFSGSDGFGASNKAVTTGAPSLALVTTQVNSAIVAGNADFAAVDGASRTWRTINSITPTAGNTLERIYQFNASFATFYAAYWTDVGSAASKTVGLSAPGSQTYTLLAVEVKGSASTPRPAPRPRVVGTPIPAATRAADW